MITSLVKGGLLGGLAVFVWGAVSWMVLPWHDMTMHRFKDEGAVAQVLTTNALWSGVYFLPAEKKIEPGMSLEEIKKATEDMQQMQQKMAQGPIVLAAIRLSGIKSMGPHLATGVVISIVGAFLVTYLMLQTHGLSYLGKVLFVTIFGLAAGVITLLPYWNWFGFSTDFTVVSIVDGVVGWLLAGLVIAKVAKGE